MVDEIAQNHLTQQELDEEVTLSGLELQLAEQAGALKRRRIESIQFCLEAMETVGGADDRDKLRAADMVRTVAFGSSSTDQPADKEVCVREVINAAGRARETGLDCKVGKLAKKLYLAEHPGFVLPKKSIYANGQLIECNMWLSSQRAAIEQALAQL